MNQVVICGAGDWGYLAYWDYFNKVNVDSFVDLNSRYRPIILQTGVQVRPMDYLKTISKDFQIVVACSDSNERNQSISILNQMGFNSISIYYPPPYMNQQYVGSLIRDRSASAINELKENRSLDLGKFLENEFRGGGATFSQGTYIYPRRINCTRLCPTIYNRTEVSLQKIS